MARALTSKQRKFAEIYAGNGTDAARKAGYSGSDNTLAQAARELLRNPQIRKAIRDREAVELGPAIATRKERQEFWTDVMLDAERPLKERLKASELLGKSEADFTDNVHLDGTVTLEQLITAATTKPPPETK